MTFPNNNLTKSVRLSLGRSVLVFISILLPITTHAGIVSFIDGIFGQEVSANTETFIESSSQNMPILEAVTTTEPSKKIPSDISVTGGEALLSEVGPSISAPDSFDNSSGRISVYIVRTGDTFAGIAKMFDVSVNTILWANDLNKNSVLKTGQSLVILPMSGVMHKVVSGDTLKGIAKKYGGDINEIAIFNDLKIDSKLAIGDTIMIPDGEASFSTRPSASSGNAAVKLADVSYGPDYVGYYQKPFLVGHRTQGIHGYNGVDYGMPIGSPIYAAASGSVIISRDSGYNGGYGDYIAIQHPNGTQTIYGHLSNPLVYVGQSVKKGQLIAYSGNTGKSTGPHLHFEIRGAKNPF